MILRFLAVSDLPQCQLMITDKLYEAFRRYIHMYIYPISLWVYIEVHIYIHT